MTRVVRIHNKLHVNVGDEGIRYIESDLEKKERTNGSQNSGLSEQKKRQQKLVRDTTIVSKTPSFDYEAFVARQSRRDCMCPRHQFVSAIIQIFEQAILREFHSQLYTS
jgi:hypothetical protein